MRSRFRDQRSGRRPARRSGPLSGKADVGASPPDPEPPGGAGTVNRLVLVWVAWVGASALLTELYFIRVFDAIVGPSAAYALVGLALFGISLAGVATAVWPRLSSAAPLRIAFGLSASPVLTWLVLRYVPFSVARIPENPLLQMGAFLLLGIVLTAPFFLSALALVQLLASGPIRKIYAADLAGSALGPWLLPGLIPLAGPAGVLLALAGGQLVGATLWLRNVAHGDRDREAAGPGAAGGRRHVRSPATALPGLVGLAAIALALFGAVSHWDVPSHAEKRSAEETRLRAEAEFRVWDPVSKIEVVDLTELDPATGAVVPGTGRKLISYDGGAQSSHIYAFDGNFTRLRAHLGDHILDHFWQRGVAAAHWFHRDEGARVFVAGSAGGQEVTAALLFGASEVLAVDLVGTVVELGTERYAEYNGGIYLDPRVRFVQGEARTELAKSERPFDIIQIFSYHNSSRVAAGSLALKAFYLQTAETYALCIDHLSGNGVLQIHQGFFPRVVTTLAEAWSLLGREDLQRHVLVYGRDGVEDHYTILVKQSPWTEAEVRNVDGFLLADFPSEGRTYTRLEDPTDRAESFLPDGLYLAPLADSLEQRAAFRITPVTDDDPFSLFLRKGLGKIEAGKDRFATSSEAVLLNEVIPERIPLPRDTAHLFLLGLAGLLVSVLAFGTALQGRGGVETTVASALRGLRGRIRETRGEDAGAKGSERSGVSLRDPQGSIAPYLYFYLIGLGFIGVEWTLVQFALRLIALPIPSFGAALGVVLIGAAIGSWASGRFRAAWVFPSIVVLGGALLIGLPALFPYLWGATFAVRLLVFVLAALPLGVLLGFPFPSALVSLRTARAVAIAWALNGAASVTGSVAVAALFASIGIQATGAVALSAYVIAGLLHPAATRASGRVRTRGRTAEIQGS